MIESVKERQKGGFDFEKYYTSLCALQDSCPLNSVKAHLNEGVLDINGDRIRMHDWMPILNAIKVNRTLKFISIRSYYQMSIAEATSSNSRVKTLRNKIPALRSKEMTASICRSLKDCLKITQTLKCIELQGIPFQESDLSIFVQGLAKNTSLCHLSFEYCGICDTGLEIVCSGLKLAGHLTSLNLTGCSLTSEGMTHLAGLIKYQAMMRHNEAWKESLRYRWANLDSMLGLKRITLNYNPGIGNDGAQAICDALKDDLWVKAIDLQECGLTNRAAQAFLHVLKFNSTLIVLDLRRNSLIDRDLLRKATEQVLINADGKEIEFKWLKPRSDPYSADSTNTMMNVRAKTVYIGPSKPLNPNARPAFRPAGPSGLAGAKSARSSRPRTRQQSSHGIHTRNSSAGGGVGALSSSELSGPNYMSASERCNCLRAATKRSASSDTVPTTTSRSSCFAANPILTPPKLERSRKTSANNNNNNINNGGSSSTILDSARSNGEDDRNYLTEDSADPDDVTPRGLPWRTAARARRYKGYPQNHTPGLSHLEENLQAYGSEDTRNKDRVNSTGKDEAFKNYNAISNMRKIMQSGGVGAHPKKWQMLADETSNHKKNKLNQPDKKSGSSGKRTARPGSATATTAIASARSNKSSSIRDKPVSSKHNQQHQHQHQHVDSDSDQSSSIITPIQKSISHTYFPDTIKGLKSELLELKRKTEAESKLRLEAESRIVGLELQNEKLRKSIKTIQHTSRGDPLLPEVERLPLDDVGQTSTTATGATPFNAKKENSLQEAMMLETIESSLLQFNAFVDMLRNAGLGNVISAAGIEHIVVNSNLQSQLMALAKRRENSKYAGLIDENQGAKRSTDVAAVRNGAGSTSPTNEARLNHDHLQEVQSQPHHMSRQADSPHFHDDDNDGDMTDHLKLSVAPLHSSALFGSTAGATSNNEEEISGTGFAMPPSIETAINQNYSYNREDDDDVDYDNGDNGDKNNKKANSETENSRVAASTEQSRGVIKRNIYMPQTSLESIQGFSNDEQQEDDNDYDDNATRY